MIVGVTAGKGTTGDRATRRTEDANILRVLVFHRRGEVPVNLLGWCWIEVVKAEGELEPESGSQAGRCNSYVSAKALVVIFIPPQVQLAMSDKAVFM